MSEHTPNAIAMRSIKLFIGLLLLMETSCSIHKGNPLMDYFGTPMPSFSLLLMDSVTKINTNNIQIGRPTVLFLFSPYCPFCKKDIENIIAHIDTLSGVNFYLLSSFPFSQVKAFSKQHHLDQYKNIVVTQDNNSDFIKYFKVKGIPFLACYNRDKKLNQLLIGNVDMKAILQLASE